jgi:curved DNA-binding protein
MLVVDVLPHDRFRRVGDDLHADVEVPVTTAALGGDVPVQTLTGTVTLTIPPETQNGTRIRLRGQGMPRLRSPDERGDLYATVSVRLPTDLTDEQRKAFVALRDAGG